jgi:hypothetical protein
MDEPEDMSHIQAPLTPEGVLNNAVAVFDRLSREQKDEFIQKYEGRTEDFHDV